MGMLFESETQAILGACFEVYREKGCGFLEDVYQECLEVEMELRNIPFVAKQSLALQYKGRKLRKAYEPDFYCYGNVILEIKAAKAIDDVHCAQIIHYLKATGVRVGLLVNFGAIPKARFERFIV